MLNKIKKHLPRLFGKRSHQVELVIKRDAFSDDPKDIETYLTDDITATLEAVFFGQLPINTRFYHNIISKDHDVTPTCEADVDKLKTLTGRILVIVYPAEPITLISIAVSIAVSVAVALLMPMPELPNQKNSAPPSPNNALAQRTNRQRLGGRIPDVFGQVWAYPDLLAPTYSFYVDNVEVECSYLCLGRGEHVIHIVRDDKTPADQVPGMTTEIFNPNVSLFDTPTMQIGANLTDDEKAKSKLLVRRYTSVNGQELIAPDKSISGSDLKVTFEAPNKIKITDGSYNFTDLFKANDKVNISSASECKSGSNLTEDADNDANTPNTPVKYNFNGEYTIVSVTDTTLFLTSPESVAPDWQKLATNTDTASIDGATFSKDSENQWQGWFYTDDDDANGLMFNLIASNGLYSTHKDGDKFAPQRINFEVQIEELSAQGQPTGIVETKSFEILGRKFAEALVAGTNDEVRYLNDDEVRKTAAITHTIQKAGKVRFRIRRTSKILFDSEGRQKVQEVKIKDLYSFRKIKPSEGTHEDLTTLYVKTKATEGALAVKERKVNMLVTRKVRNWQDNDKLIVSKRADDIIYHIATDPKIGGLSKDDLDMTQIHAEVEIIRNYFKENEQDTRCIEFCDTFDSTALSAEETIGTVAKAIFSTAYRYQVKIRLHFERPMPASVALFTSYNILPNTYKNPKRFGSYKDLESVKVSYNSVVDDAQVNLYHPNKASNNQFKLELKGVRNKKQAHAHMMRRFNKIMYSNATLEITGADESNIVIPTQRITVADQTNAFTQDGEVVNFDSSTRTLTLSNAVTVNANDVIFIQTLNNVDNIKIASQTDSYNIVLERSPAEPISQRVDGNVVTATYEVVSNSDSNKYHYIVTEKTPGDGVTNTINAINYDDRYYSNDKDKVEETEKPPLPFGGANEGNSGISSPIFDVINYGVNRNETYVTSSIEMSHRLKAGTEVVSDTLAQKAVGYYGISRAESTNFSIMLSLQSAAQPLEKNGYRVVISANTHNPDTFKDIRQDLTMDYFFPDSPPEVSNEKRDVIYSKHQHYNYQSPKNIDGYNIPRSLGIKVHKYKKAGKLYLVAEYPSGQYFMAGTNVFDDNKPTDLYIGCGVPTENKPAVNLMEIPPRVTFSSISNNLPSIVAVDHPVYDYQGSNSVQIRIGNTTEQISFSVISEFNATTGTSASDPKLFFQGGRLRVEQNGAEVGDMDLQIGAYLDFIYKDDKMQIASGSKIITISNVIQSEQDLRINLLTTINLSKLRVINKRGLIYNPKQGGEMTNSSNRRYTG